MNGLIQQTLAALRATPRWALHATYTLLGSRFFVGVSALSFVAFLAHATRAPTRFPPFAQVSLSAMLGLGLGPSVTPAPALPDDVATPAGEALAAGAPYVQAAAADALGAASAYFAANPDAVVTGNYVGLSASGVALVAGLYCLAQQELRR